MNANEIQALLSLLDDPDPEVQTHIRERIVTEGRDMLPYLNSFGLAHEEDKKMDVLINDIRRDIQVGCLGQELDTWYASADQDLITGACIIGRYEYPDLEEQEVQSFVARIRQDVWLELNDNLTAFERIKVLNLVFFEEYGFKGDKENYHRAENSFINKVIENRAGNPLLLSVLYMAVAEQLEIPIAGINLPNHFLVAYLDETGLIKAMGQSDDHILFYINPFSRGAILHRAEIDTFLKHLDLSPEPRFFSPCTHADMVRRMINNLIHSYQKSGETGKVEELSAFVKSVTRSES